MGVEVFVPDIGDFDDVEVVEVLVAKGDRVEAEDPLISIESDKATMELPSPHAGVVDSVAISVGDRVSQGALICVIDAEAGAEAEAAAAPADAPAAAAEAQANEPQAAEPQVADKTAAEDGSGEVRAPGERPALPPPVQPAAAPSGALPHASPLVRKQARELGVHLSLARGTGPAGRILVDDVKGYVRESLAGGGAGGAAIEAIPAVDFSKFGEIEEQPLAKIRRVSARNLSRAWLNVPHVTQHDEADVTDIEAHRKALKERAAEAGVKLSPLVFVMKAVVQALRKYPEFRSSLSPDGESLIVKNYIHLGIAVDTERGLVVPVVRDVDQKGLIELAGEMSELAEKARNRKLSPADMQGGVFSISSLGGVGGTAFTPIVNAPEVAILGVSKLLKQPKWDDGAAEGEGAFVPRLVLPLSLSYDHRVIDGAAAARFTTELVRVLADPVNLLL